MIACFDVQYEGQKAYIAGLLFQNWSDDHAYKAYVDILAIPEEYQSGQFYKRELPCLLHLIPQIVEPLDFLVVDGYCYLSKEGKKGLGAYLFEQLGQKIPVIGVAKNRFKSENQAQPWIRGQSKKPLFVSAAGITPNEAMEFVQQMHGPYRIPTLLKMVDMKARAWEKQHRLTP